MLLSDFRSKYPEYDDMDDQTLARGIHEKYYSDVDYNQFSQNIGLQTAELAAPANGDVTNDIVSAFQGTLNQGIENPIAQRNQSVTDYQKPPEPETMSILGQEIDISEQFPSLNQTSKILNDLDPNRGNDELISTLDRIAPGKRKPAGMYPDDDISPVRETLQNIFGEVTPEQNAVDMVQAAAMSGGKEEGISAQQYLEETAPKTGVLTRAAKDVGSGAISTADGMLGYMSRMTGNQDIRMLQTEMAAKARKLMPANPTFLDEVGAGFGSTATFFVPGVGIMKGAQALSKVSPTMGTWLGSGSAAGLEAATEAGAVYTELRDKGLNHKDAAAKADNVFWANAALVSVTNKLGLFNNAGNQIKRRSLAAVSEGILQEAPQQIISNVNTDKDWKEGVAKSAAIGSIVGGTLGGGIRSKEEELGAELDKSVNSSNINVEDIAREQLNPNNQGNNNQVQEKPIAEQILEQLQSSVKQPPAQGQYSNNSMASNIVELLTGNKDNASEAQNNQNAGNEATEQDINANQAESPVVRQEETEAKQEKAYSVHDDMSDKEFAVRKEIMELTDRLYKDRDLTDAEKVEIQSEITDLGMKLSDVIQGKETKEAEPEVKPAISRNTKQSKTDVYTKKTENGWVSNKQSTAKGITSTSLERATQAFATEEEAKINALENIISDANVVMYGDSTRMAYNEASKLKQWASKELDKYKPKTEGVPPESGFAVANIDEKGTIYYGKPNEIHNDLSLRYPHKQRGDWKSVGFADSTGKFYTREEALEAVNKDSEKVKPSANMEGQLDALDYNEQKNKVVQQSEAGESVAPEHTHNDGRKLDDENVFSPMYEDGVIGEADVNENDLPEYLSAEEFKEVTDEYIELFKNPDKKVLTEKRIKEAEIKKAPVPTQTSNTTWEISASKEAIAELIKNRSIKNEPKGGAKVTVVKTDKGYVVESNYNNRYDMVSSVKTMALLRGVDHEFNESRDSKVNNKKSKKKTSEENAVATYEDAMLEAQSLWLEIETAILVHDKWTDEAIDQRENDEMRKKNSNKVILSLFDLSGAWGQPFADAGYNVIPIDIQDGLDVMKMDPEYLYDEMGIEGDIYGILAACPCTDFANSGAKHFKGKDADGRTEASKDLVIRTLELVETLRPKFWVVENPIGRIETYKDKKTGERKQMTGLPEARMSFDPWNFGHAYTKKTQLWGKFNAELPLAPVEPVLGSKMHSKFGGKSIATKNARSETPAGFAYAFFKANNYFDKTAEERLIEDYPELTGAIKQALKVGMSEEQINEAVEGVYESEWSGFDSTPARDELLEAIKEFKKPELAEDDLGDGISYSEEGTIYTPQSTLVARKIENTDSILDELLKSGKAKVGDYNVELLTDSRGAALETDAPSVVDEDSADEGYSFDWGELYFGSSSDSNFTGHYPKLYKVAIEYKYGEAAHALDELKALNEKEKLSAKELERKNHISAVQSAMVDDLLGSGMSANNMDLKAKRTRKDITKTIKDYAEELKAKGVNVPNRKGRLQLPTEKEMQRLGIEINQEALYTISFRGVPLLENAQLLYKTKEYMRDALLKAYPLEGKKPALKHVADEAPESGTPLANTDDVGGEMFGNLRQTGLSLSDIKNADNDSQKLLLAQKKKIWERPDYEAMVAGGVEPAVAHTIKQIYDTIPTKPAYKTDKFIYAYVEGIEALRKATDQFLGDKEAQAAVIKYVAEQASRRSRGSFSLIQDGVTKQDKNAPKPHEYILDIVFPKNKEGHRWGRGNDEGNVRANALGNKLYRSLDFSVNGYVKAMKAIKEGWPAKQEAWQRSYSIQSKAEAVTTDDISMREGAGMVPKVRVRVGYRSMETFDSMQEAEEYVKDMPEFYLIGKKRGLVGTYPTRNEALESVRDLTKREKIEKFKEPAVPVEKSKRTAPEVREGKNVSTQDLMNTFGFSAINFGNWMKGGGNAKERQAHANSLYDSAHDLARLLDIPIKAISFNGTLGVAVGAQGRAGAAAHFIPGANEINITRGSGAGSFAHEWGHALDYHFGVLAGTARTSEPFLSEHTWGIRKDAEVRLEIKERFETIVNTMNTIEKDYSKEDVEAFRVKALANNQKDLNNWLDRYASPEKPSKKYTALINKIKEGDVGEMGTLGKSKNYVGSNVNLLREEYKKLSGRYFSLDTGRAINSNAEGVSRYGDSKEYFEKHPKTRSTRTDYAKNASKLEKGTKRYWSTNLEKFARAFEMYVLDSLAAENQRNDYLTSPWKNETEGELGEEAMLRYPQGVEREAINLAFDGLIEELKSKETEKGVALYSKEKPDNSAKLNKDKIKSEVNDLIFEGGQVAELSELNQEKVDEQQQSQDDLERIITRYRKGLSNGRTDGQRLDGELHRGSTRNDGQRSMGEVRAELEAIRNLQENGLETPAFKEYMDGAFFVAENGKPIHLLHGTQSESIHQFNKETLGTKSGGAPSGLGFFTTQDKAEAVGYATDKNTREVKGSVFSLVTNIENPYVIEKGRDIPVADETVENYAEVRHALQAAGYDGIYVKGVGHVVAFESINLKTIKQEDAKTGKISRIALGTFDKDNPKTFYSKENKPASSGFSVSEVEKIIAPVVLKWGTKAPKIEVVQSIDEIPEHVIDADEHGVEHISAVHYGDDETIYLVAGKLKDEEHVLSRLAHEAIGHHSFEEIMGDDLGNVLERVQWLKKSGDEKLTAIAQEVSERYGKLDKVTEAKEIVALVAEKGISSPLLTKVIAAIRNFLRKIGFNLKWSKTDLEGLVVKAAKNLEKDRTGKTKSNHNTNKGMFSREAEEVFDSIDEEASKVPTFEQIKEKLGDKIDDARPNLLYFVNRMQLADIGKNVLPQAQTYVATAQKMDAERNHLIAEAAEIAQNWHEYMRDNDAQSFKLADLMHDATMAGVDPAEKYESIVDKKEALDRIRTLQTLAKGSPGEAYKFVNESNEIKQKMMFDKAREKKYPALKERFDKLPKEARNIYKNVRDFYMHRFNETQQVLMDRVDRSEISQSEKAKLKNKMRLQFESAQTQAPYFPLARFGDFWVSVAKQGKWQEKYRVQKGKSGGASVYYKNGKRPISSFDSFEEAREWMNKKVETAEFFMFTGSHEQKEFAKKQRAAGHNVTTGKKLENIRAMQGASEGFVAEVIGAMEELSGSLSTQAKDDIWQLYLNTLPDMSVRKHFIHRKKMKGYSQDALHAFANQSFHGSYQLAKLKYSDVLETQLENMRDNVPQSSDPNKASDIVNELQKRHEWAMNPQGAALPNNATQLAFVWYLGLTPSAAIVNTSQTALVALPIMGAEFGWAKSTKALTSAAKDFFSGHVGIKEGVFSAGEVLTGDEKRAFQQWLDDGVIDKTLAHDMAALSEKESDIYSDKKAKVMGVVSYAFHHAERFNREVTALAAYRLARQSGMSHVNAVNEARRITYDSHFDYSSANKARFMQNDAAKVIFIFRQYSLNMTYLLARNTQLMLRGESKEVRRMAKRKLAGVLGMHALFVGLYGMPLFWLVESILNTIFDDEDEPWEFAVEFRNYLTDMLGETAAEAITVGAVQTATDIGVHNRLSLNELWIRDPGRDLEAQKSVEYYMLQLGFGPLGSIFTGAGRGVDMMKKGHVKRGVEAMVPKAIRDGLKAMRYADEGVTSMSGDKVVDDVNAWQIFLQGIGFSSGEVSKQYDANSALRNYKTKIDRRRQLLVNRWWLALDRGDTEAHAESLDDIRTFNGKNPTKKISIKTLKQSLKIRKIRSSQSEHGVYLRKNERHLRDRVRYGND